MLTLQPARPARILHPALALAALLGLIAMLRLVPAQPYPTPAATLAAQPLAFAASASGVGMQSVGGPAIALGLEGVRVAVAADAALQIAFVGARPNPAIAGAEPLPGVLHRYRGADPSLWQRGLPTYAAATYAQLWPGIDVRYDGPSGALKSAYSVAPHADPALIRWRYEGAASTSVDPRSGDLLIALAGGHEVRERAPVAWQESAGRRSPVQARFVEHADGTLGFALGAYDATMPLVIDPELTLSARLGGSGADTPADLALDTAGNRYMVGTTTSTDWPNSGGTTGGEGDVFVTKIAPGGTVLATFYLGGEKADLGHAVDVDSAGNIWVTGDTASSQFPLVDPFPDAWRSYQPDAFVARFNSAGELKFSTAFNGTRAFFAVAGGRELVVAPNDEVYVAGPLGDSLLGKFAAGGNRFAATYGGSSARVDVNDYALALDAQGNVYLAGTIRETALSTVNAVQTACGAAQDGGGCTWDAFVIKIAPDLGHELFSTYLGGGGASIYAGAEWLGGIAVDAGGALYLAGGTTSSDFPLANAYQTQLRYADGTAYVTKLVPDGAGYRIAYSTYLGGSEFSTAAAVVADDAGNAYVVGHTNATDFPTLSPLQPANGGGSCVADYKPTCKDLFVTQIGSEGGLVFSSYWGGARDEYATALELDAGGLLLAAGYTNSANFPTHPAPPTAPAGGSDAFLIAIDPRGANNFPLPTATTPPAQATATTPPLPTATSVPGEPTGPAPSATATRPPAPGSSQPFKAYLPLVVGR